MQYLASFTFPDAEREFDHRLTVRRTCYDTLYPFGVLSARRVETLRFEPLTLLCGGNGSGKTTALNVMAEKLSLLRQAPYNRSSFFGDYIALCQYELLHPLPPGSCVVTSDDVFDFMLDLRALNEGIDARREQVFEEYQAMRHSEFRLRGLEDYDELRRVVRARRQTQSCFTRDEVGANARERSNGESAFAYFTERVGENGLFLLDEPENSLSPMRQRELAAFLLDSVRFYGCQFVVATHSPFLLALSGARVYDLDSAPAAVRPWTQLPPVRAYYEFFRERAGELENEGEGRFAQGAERN